MAAAFSKDDFRRIGLGLAAAVAIAAATACTFAAFGAHIFFGGLYEKRTVIAMSMRTLVWATIAAIATRGCGTR